MGSAHHRVFRLTASLVSTHVGGSVVCLDEAAIGRSFRLFASRPESVVPLTRGGIRAEIINGPDEDLSLEDELDDSPVATRVDIQGPLLQRATYNDSGCGGGWTDGYDAICERMVAALEQGNVLLVIDSPGGAVSGIQEAIRRIRTVKAQHGRTILAYADECMASAAYWLAATVADEIYIPSMGAVGSIGARSAHESIAGALDEAGVEVTNFAWPGKGKIAFARESPLSELGKKRAMRDVTIAGEAFAAAVVAARPGLTREAIVRLNADCLTGQHAVNAGLVDGVASLDEVLAELVAITDYQEAQGAQAV